MNKHTPHDLSRVLVRKRNAPPLSSEDAVVTALASAAVSLVAGLLVERLGPELPAKPAGHDDTARGLRRAAAMLSASALVDSAFEHFRGNYENRAMFVAPLTAALNLGAAASGTRFRSARGAVFGLGAMVGCAGLLFHIYNVVKRPGGFSWNNLFYAAPLGAPGSIALAGAMGLAAMPLEKGAPPSTMAQAPLRAGRILTLGTAAGLLATVAEVWLLHFRGAFHNPAMYLPVTLPPITSAVMTATAIDPTPGRIAMCRRLLGLTSVMGILGAVLHAFGVHRNMGGWRNWTQMLFQGPPVPAPPGFAALGLAGMAALKLLDKAIKGAERG